MQTEFKFRAFGGNKILDHDFISRFAVADLSNGFFEEVMMYLFYKDKNGTEVYQNDILKLKILNSRHNTHFYVFRIAEFNKPIYGSYPYSLESFEVVGNKYNNIELFNETLNKN